MQHGWIAGLCRIAITAVTVATLLPMNVQGSKAESIAGLPQARPLLTNGRDEPTTAWEKFCIRLPEECRIDLAEPAVVTLTPDVWRLLQEVNKRANLAIKPKTDRERWGVEDRWTYPDDGYGDCEDYQLLKRKLLTEAGLPRRAMRMTVVVEKDGSGHAVLMIRSDRGDFILDNNTKAVLAWNETGYRFVKRESSDGHEWVALGDGAPRKVVASRSVAKREAPTLRRR